MYRYIVDKVITYTPEDLVLFRESPFAVWMERLTLENPEHGIPPDLDSYGAHPQPPQQDDIVATLRAEGRNVALIDASDEEPDRRVATLEAMRVGADFIVNAQLAVDAFSGTVDLLMRTSGFSELGDYLYIPCETRIDRSKQSPFRLCFAAELLANLQGQLPAQMLIIRDGAEVVPLQTEDHIYYYRAVEKRFLNAMNIFRKHRMPDPAESAHFGRWAECASEVLKQRALSGPEQEEQAVEEAHEAVAEMPQLRVASGAGTGAQYSADVAGQQGFGAVSLSGNASALEGRVTDSDTTLAEQARLLQPGHYGRGAPPGHTPSLARIGKSPAVAAAPENADALPVDPVSVATDSDEPVAEKPRRGEHKLAEPKLKESKQNPKLNKARSGKPESDKPATYDYFPDEALDNLEFIGSGPSNINSAKFPDMDLGEAVRAAPAPNLRDTAAYETETPFGKKRSATVELSEREPRPPLFLPPDKDDNAAASAPKEQLDIHSQDSGDLWVEDASSVIDMDSAPAATIAPVVQRAEEVFKRLIRDDPMFKKVEPAKPRPEQKKSNTTAAGEFSSSLHTSEEFNDR